MRLIEQSFKTCKTRVKTVQGRKYRDAYEKIHIFFSKWRNISANLSNYSHNLILSDFE